MIVYRCDYCESSSRALPSRLTLTSSVTVLPITHEEYYYTGYGQNPQMDNKCKWKDWNCSHFTFSVLCNNFITGGAYLWLRTCSGLIEACNIPLMCFHNHIYFIICSPLNVTIFLFSNTRWFFMTQITEDQTFMISWKTKYVLYIVGPMGLV